MNKKPYFTYKPFTTISTMSLHITQFASIQLIGKIEITCNFKLHGIWNPVEYSPCCLHGEPCFPSMLLTRVLPHDLTERSRSKKSVTERNDRAMDKETMIIPRINCNNFWIRRDENRIARRLRIIPGMQWSDKSSENTQHIQKIYNAAFQYANFEPRSWPFSLLQLMKILQKGEYQSICRYTCIWIILQKLISNTNLPAKISVNSILGLIPKTNPSHTTTAH